MVFHILHILLHRSCPQLSAHVEKLTVCIVCLHNNERQKPADFPLSCNFSCRRRLVENYLLTDTRRKKDARKVPGNFLKKGLISWEKYGIICFCIKGILCPEVNFREQEV